MTRLVIKDSGDRHWFKMLRMEITGGIHEEDGDEQHDQGPLSVVEVAAVNEFGGGRIPARMWLRGWVTKNKRRVVQEIRMAMTRMASTQKFHPDAFQLVTEELGRSLREQILNGSIKPANAPLTLLKKSPETRPLVEHGQLVNAIHAKMHAKNESGSINWSHED